MNQQEKIVVELVERKPEGEKLKAFLKICFEISDTISLNSCDTKQMLKEEVQQAKQEFNERLKQLGRRPLEDEERYRRYPIPYAQSKQAVEEWITQHIGEYQIIKREVTCMSEYTSGPPQVIYHFDTKGLIKQKMDQLENIFDCIVIEEEGEVLLEDPVFYKQEKVIGAICSHEAMGKFEFKQTQYEAFRKLRIPHQILNPTQKMTLEEWLEECAYQESEELTIHGWQQAIIPKQLGQVTTLKQLQIFDHQVSQLPQSLEQLTQLECLRITGNQVTDLGFDLSKLKNLKILDLGGMLLQTFPEGILELEQLKELYLGDATFKRIPEAIMNLKNLHILSLPAIDEQQLSPQLKAFKEKLAPYSHGIGLRSILGEEKWQELLARGDCIMSNE